MNVFILSTGRCGSMTLARACAHARNYSVGHESRAHLPGPQRLAYPPRHIESDNRLAWFLGRLGRSFPDDVLYVHLRRDPEAVARSYAKRLEPGMILPAYAHGVYLGWRGDLARDALALAQDYVATVNANIEAFLAGRGDAMVFDLEQAETAFPALWARIGADGDLAAALAEFRVRHNASD